MPYYIDDDAAGCSGWATVKDDGEIMGCHETKQEAIDQALAIAQSEGSTYEGERNASEPAPPEDQVEGSDENEPGSASGAGGDIELSDATKTALRNKVEEHNEKMDEQDKPAYTRTTYGQLAAVYRRGAGAYSVSHRPGVSRGAWAMARVNAYLYLLRNGRPENSKYVGDNDLLPEDHPRSTRSLDARDVELNLPQYIRDAAAQGIEWHEEGLSGDGVVPRTVREARQMARGEISEDKVIRVSAWAARHATDLDAEGARPDEDGFPTPGAVAHYLWGIPTGARYPDAVAWFDRKAEQIREDEGRSMSTATPVKPRSSKSGVEFRSVDYEIRTDGEGRTFTGYAAMFDSPSEPLPFIERIAPGAFARSLANRKRDVRLYVNHNSDMVLASKRSGTLRLAEDDRGLRVDADLPDTSYANDLRALMEAGVVSKMSFGFSVPRGGDKWSDDGSERVLRAVTLHEVSVVTGFPAYDATQAAVRSLEKLSERTGLAVDELTEALDALSDGSELTEEQAAALKAAVDQASPRNEPDAPNLLTIKSLKTELLGKQII